MSKHRAEPVGGKPPSPKEAAADLLAYCRDRGWAGYDPYDALNSRVFRVLPFLDFKLFRLAMTQTVKRLPFNIRPGLLIPRSKNPKGIALFLAASVRLSRAGLVAGNEDIAALAGTLLDLRSKNIGYSCWGYDFPWQNRSLLVPQGTPNVICTSFAAQALLDTYEATGGEACREAAESGARYILDKLLIRENDGIFFSYTPLGTARVHNANLLGAALVARIGRLTGSEELIGTALEAARYAVRRQNKDGSWFYGEDRTQKWIDNFHTGYNLTALQAIAASAWTTEFDAAIGKGLAFYMENFFMPDGAPKYYHDALYPIDIHSVAQAVITLVRFGGTKPAAMDQARSVLRWGLRNMRSGRGFFYFQKHRRYTVRTPFMRWSEAWMLLALAEWLAAGSEKTEALND